jgi:hypothetical protein
MNKITLIEDNDTHSDFIVDFPLKDISVDGKRLDKTYRNTKQLKLLNCVFGAIILIIMTNCINSSKAKDTVLESIQVGERIRFNKPTYGVPVGGDHKGRLFHNGIIHTVTSVGLGGNRFRVKYEDIEYKFYNANNSFQTSFP